MIAKLIILNDNSDNMEIWNHAQNANKRWI